MNGKLRGRERALLELKLNGSLLLCLIFFASAARRWCFSAFVDDGEGKSSKWRRHAIPSADVVDTSARHSDADGSWRSRIGDVFSGIWVSLDVKDGAGQ